MNTLRLDIEMVPAAGETEATTVIVRLHGMESPRLVWTMPDLAYVQLERAGLMLWEEFQRSQKPPV